MPALGPHAPRNDAKPKSSKPKPKARVKRPSASSRARAQEQAYESQGEAVEKEANSQKAQAKRKQVERTTKAREQEYKSQGEQVEKAANHQKKYRKAQERGHIEVHPGRQLKKELEGRGALAHALDWASKHTYTVSTGGGPAAPGTKLAKAKRHTPLGAATIKADESTAAGRLVKDAITFPAQALPAVYQPVAGAVEAARGRPQRIKKVVEDFKQTDPIYNTVAAGVEAAKGNKAAAKSHLKKAEKTASEHPGLTAFEVYGAKGVAGRSAGAAARSGALGKGAKRAAATERAPKRVPNTNIVENRAYSRDVITKGAQVAVEKSKRRKAAKLRKKAQTAPVEQARALRERAARIDPDRVREHEIKRRVDERVGANEDIRRTHRAQVAERAQKIVKPVKREGVATSLVTQRIARGSRQDLLDYANELEREFDGLSPSQKRANKDLRRQIQKVADDPKADFGKVEDAARAYEDLTRPLQKKLVEHQLLSKDQAERAALIPYAVRRMGAKHDGDQVVSKTGVPLSNEAIQAHMKAHGESPAAWMTQAPGQRGARNFYVPTERPVRASAGKRTGKATKAGTFDADSETLVEGAARQQGLVDATEGFRSLVNEFGVRHPKTGKLRVFQTHKQAARAMRDLVHDENGEPIPGAHSLRPVRINPLGGTKNQLESFLKDVNVEGDLKDALVEAVRSGDDHKPGPWALVPEAVAERLTEHMSKQGGGAGIKTLQLAQGAFRRTVLSTSPSWFAGNFIEAIGRAALNRAGPASYVRGRRTLAQLHKIDHQAAEEAAHRIIGGGHYAMADRTHVRRGAEQFEATRLAPVATALGRFWRTPGPKQAANLWKRWTDLAFHDINGTFESTVQTAMLGKELKRAGYKAIDDAARGLTKTENQVEFGRAVDRMYGKYSKLSPGMRHMISTYTPFIQWAINSTYFVYRTLPRDHPVTTSVIAAAELATEEWRQDKGLDQFMGEGALPGFLQGSIPMSGGRHFRASRFTPFGAFASPSETAAGQVLPLWGGVLAALARGEDWKGKEFKVKNPDGSTRKANEVERFVFAAKAFADSTIPILSLGQRVADNGPSALNPFRPVAPPPAKNTRRKRVARSYNQTSGNSTSPSILAPPGGGGHRSTASGAVVLSPSGGHGSNAGGAPSILAP